MVTESEILMEIGRRRGTEPKYASHSALASSADFDALAERAGQSGGDVLIALGRMRERGLITCSNADSNNRIDDIALTEEGERRMASTLIVQGETE